MARFGEVLSGTAIILAGAMVVLLLLIEYVLPAGDELFAGLSFLAGVLAPALAIAGFAVVKLSGNRASRLAVFGLVFGILALAWPALFFLAYSNCANGLC